MDTGKLKANAVAVKNCGFFAEVQTYNVLVQLPKQ
jgi:hypothetical protein